MKRLTTDNPKDNIENSLNLFYGKDGWTWVRGGGPAPDYADISLCDLVRTMVKANIPDAELPEDDDALPDLMYAWLMDEPTTAEGIISLLYTAGWAFAELRHRLAHYEDLKEQGHLMELPCKVGDVLYDITLGEVKEKTVVSIAGLLSQHVNRITVHASNKRGAITEVDMREIGKTVFLTREEAERALAGGADNG